jgi:hypothetical protein
VGIGLNYRIRHTNEKPEYYVHWQLDPDYDNNVKTASGYFRFYWMDGNHTLVRYGTLVESKFLIPPNLQQILTRAALPDALGSVKKWVDSKGEYRKRGYQPQEQ